MSTVNVTDGCINGGRLNNCRRCPVARALTLAFGGTWFVVATIGEPGTALRLQDEFGITLPDPVAEKILAYDMGRGMEPFSFTLTEEPPLLNAP